MRLFKPNPRFTSPEQAERAQLMAPSVLVILLTIAIIVVGYVLSRQTSTEAVTVQAYLTNLQRLWPLSVDTLDQYLENVALPLFWFGLLISWLIALVALAVSRRNSVVMLILMALSVYGLFLYIPLIFGGVVLLADLLLLLLVALTSGRLFSESLTARFMTFAIGNSILALILDLFVPWKRLAPISEGVMYVLYAVLLLSFGTVVASGFRRYPLRQKLLFTMAGVSVLSIVAVAVVSIGSTQTSIRSTASQALLTAASQAANGVDGFINSISESLASEAQNEVFINYLTRPASYRTPEVENGVNSVLRQMLSRRSAASSVSTNRLSYLQGYSLLDNNGVVVRDTEPLFVGEDMSQDEIFLRPFIDSKTFVTAVRFDSAGRPFIYFSTPVYTGGGAIAGILAARFNGLVLQQLVYESNDLAGPGSYAILFEDQYYIEMGNGNNAQLNFKMPLPASDALLAEIKAKQLLSSRPGAQTTSNQLELGVALEQMRPLWEEYALARSTGEAHLAEVPTSERDPERRLLNAQLSVLQSKLSFTYPDFLNKKPTLTAFTGLRSTPWYIVYTQAEEYFLAPVKTQARNIQLLALAIALGAAVLAFVLAQFLAEPIAGLTQVASGIASGDFSHQVPIEANDEIGKLAQTVNLMAGQLEQTLTGLEKRVEERTSDLLRRSTQMQAAAEVGRTASNLRSINELLPRICQLISERFSLYHVGIFLIDETGRFAVLRASNSEGGRRMLERGHRLGVGQQGIVGYVTSVGQSRIALDVGDDAVFFNNPDLPLTRSEVALPLQAGGRLFGALDVQSTESAAFSTDDVVVLQVMADLVATAIENARLLGESQQALETTRRAYGEISRRGWSDLLRTQEALGYRSTDRGVFLTSKESKVEGPQDESSIAPEKASLPIPVSTDEAKESPLSIPIWVRDSVVGYLETSKPSEKGSWSEEEIETVTKIVEQLGVALEGARLYKGSQIQAERERLISEITSRMRESLDVEAVLQVAAGQIRQALELKTVTVSLGVDEISPAGEPVE